MTELYYMQADAPLKLKTAAQEIKDGVVILPATVFYAQGGGQPFDKGLIIAESGTFRVDKVQNVDGTVYHHGEFVEGIFGVGDKVHCEVDVDRRRVNTLLHSGGHLLDLAVKKLGYGWIPSKGYHYPNGSYVEYAGTLEGDPENFACEINSTTKVLILENLPVRVEYMNRSQMETQLLFVPEYLPTNRPSRVVFMGETGIPCGGTHVKSLGEISAFNSEKIRIKGGNIRVSYSVK